MNRRRFLTTSAAVAMTAALPGQASAVPVEYSPGLLRERLAAGDTVVMLFRAAWSHTCQLQLEALTRLKSDNPAYLDKLTFIYVDWDTYRAAQMTERLKVKRRSTFVVLQGRSEVARMVAETSEHGLRKFMDKALAAATG